MVYVNLPPPGNKALTRHCKHSDKISVGIFKFSISRSSLFGNNGSADDRMLSENQLGEANLFMVDSSIRPLHNGLVESMNAGMTNSTPLHEHRCGCLGPALRRAASILSF